MADNIPQVKYFTGDTLPAFNFSIEKDDGTGALNLTGATVRCYFRIQGSSTNFLSGTNADCSIISATSGTVLYQLPTAFVDPGIYTGQLVIVFSGPTRQQRTQRFEVQVLDGLAYV